MFKFQFDVETVITVKATLNVIHFLFFVYMFVIYFFFDALSSHLR